MYLTAITDWFSRKIMGWELSDTLENAPVLDAVRSAVERFGIPAILNSDQGSQFTSAEYKALLHSLNIRQSMDGKSRWADNIMIERWFRSLKTQNIYINEFHSPKELRQSVRQYISEYNTLRPHEALDYAKPEDIYCSCFAPTAAALSRLNRSAAAGLVHTVSQWLRPGQSQFWEILVRLFFLCAVLTGGPFYSAPWTPAHTRIYFSFNSALCFAQYQIYFLRFFVTFDVRFDIAIQGACFFVPFSKIFGQTQFRA